MSLPLHRTVSDVMTSQVHVASPVAPFKLLVRLIEENRVSAIPIVDQQGLPVGIVSESDLLLKERRVELETSHDLLHVQKRRQDRAKAWGTVASDLMTSPAMTVPSDTSLGEAARLMHERNVRRLSWWMIVVGSLELSAGATCCRFSFAPTKSCVTRSQPS